MSSTSLTLIFLGANDLFKVSCTSGKNIEDKKDAGKGVVRIMSKPFATGVMCDVIPMALIFLPMVG